MNLTAEQMAKAEADINRFFQTQKEKTGAISDTQAEMLVKQGELQARLLELEQKAARRRGGGDPGGGGDYNGSAMRALLDGNADIAAVVSNRARRAVVDVPAGYFAAVTSPTVVLPQQFPGLVGGAPERRMTVRQLLSAIPVESGALQYVQETGYTNNAATVSETTEKPESALIFEIKTANIQVIAHWIKVSVQVVADTPALQSFIDRRLRYGLAIIEEAQLLKGSGSGNNLEGLTVAATAFTGSTAGTKIDVLRRAAEQLETTDYQPSGFVLNPTDWAAIDLTKDTVGVYVLGSPARATAAQLWGLPVALSNSMTSGNFLVGDFQQAALLLDRQEARVEISAENQDDWIKNMLTVRAEERIGLAILRPGALIKGTFGT